MFIRTTIDDCCDWVLTANYSKPFRSCSSFSLWLLVLTDAIWFVMTLVTVICAYHRSLKIPLVFEENKQSILYKHLFTLCIHNLKISCFASMTNFQIPLSLVTTRHIHQQVKHWGAYIPCCQCGTTVVVTVLTEIYIMLGASSSEKWHHQVNLIHG